MLFHGEVEMFPSSVTTTTNRRQQHRAGDIDAFTEAIQRTQQPIVTGTSVLGIKYKDGVMLAADNLASYGSLARFKDIQRLHPVGDCTILAASGDMADFQQVQRMLENVMCVPPFPSPLV